MSKPSRRSLIGLVALVLAVGGTSEWWQAREARQAGEALARLARAGDIEMISSTSCVFCTQARQFMTVQRVPFSECFIETDPVCAQRYQALGARGTPTMLVRGQPMLGFSAALIRDRLAAGTARPGT